MSELYVKEPQENKITKKQIQREKETILSAVKTHLLNRVK